MNGRISDGRVLKRSKLGQMLEKGSLNLPAPEPLPGRSVRTPYVFIGDDAFTLQPNFMKPFSRKNLDLLTKICNHCFSRARQISENVFGTITNHWRVYRSPISLHLKKLDSLQWQFQRCIIGYEVDSRKRFICHLDFVIHMIRQLNHSFPVAGGKEIITIA